MVRSHFEGFWQTQDNLQIFYQLSKCEKAVASLVITHGQGEHSSSYVRVLKALADLPYNIYLWDLRGHGRSQGQRGFASSFKEYIHDYEQFLHMLQQQHKIFSHPVYLLGHSMGGLISASYLCQNANTQIQKLVLSSPLLALKKEVPSYKKIAAQTVAKYLPKLTLGNEILDMDLTRDRAVLDEFKKDSLRHNMISAGVYLGFLEEIENVKSKIMNVQQKILLQVSDSDPVVDGIAVSRLFENIQNCETHIYLNRKHEIYNDLERDEVFKDLISFLKK